jgi:Mor family transcriptional regulator
MIIVKLLFDGDDDEDNDYDRTSWPSNLTNLFHTLEAPGSNLDPQTGVIT